MVVDLLQKKIEKIEVPVGYVSAAAVGSTPIWVQSLTGYLELVAVLFAVLVGATTAYINILSILDKREKRKKREP